MSDPDRLEALDPTGQEPGNAVWAEEYKKALRDSAGITELLEGLDSQLEVAPRAILGNPGGASAPAVSVGVAGGLSIYEGILRAGGAEAWRLRNIYYANRPTGEVGTGTYLDPYNVGTPALFDQRMTELYDSGEWANLTFAAALYKVRPKRPHEIHPVVNGVYDDWYIANGWFINGAGKGRTIFQCADGEHDAGDATGSRIIFRSSREPGDAGVAKFGCFRNCTINGQVTSANVPGPATSYTLGMDLDVGDYLLENVHFEFMGGKGQEMFPLIMGYGIAAANPSAPPRINLRVTGCSSANLFHAGQGTGLLFYAVDPGDHQKWEIYNNDFKDCYITGVNTWHFSAHDNDVTNGLADYSCFNWDTGNNQHVEIFRNNCYGGGSSGNNSACIVVGTILDDPIASNFRYFKIYDNLLKPAIGSSKLTTPIYFPGNVIGAEVRNNRMTKSTGWPDLGLALGDRMPGGYTAGNQLSAGWHAPLIPNGPVESSGNFYIEDASTPTNLPNTTLADASFNGVRIGDLAARMATLEYQPMAITTLTASIPGGGSTAEVGDTVPSVTFGLSLNKTAGVTLSMNQGVGALASTTTSFVRTANVTTDTTFTLTAEDNTGRPGHAASRSVSVVFRHKAYWGIVVTDAAPTSADILNLTSKVFATGRQREITMDAPAEGGFPVYAFLASYGEPTFMDGGFVSSNWERIPIDLQKANGNVSPYLWFRLRDRQFTTGITFQVL